MPPASIRLWNGCILFHLCLFFFGGKGLWMIMISRWTQWLKFLQYFWRYKQIMLFQVKAVESFPSSPSRWVYFREREHKEIRKQKYFSGITDAGFANNFSSGIKLGLLSWWHPHLTNPALSSVCLSPLFLGSVPILLPCFWAFSLGIIFKTPNQRGCGYTVLSLSNWDHPYRVSVCLRSCLLLFVCLFNAERLGLTLSH